MADGVCYRAREVRQVTLECGDAYNINILLAIFKWSPSAEERKESRNSGMGK